MVNVAVSAIVALSCSMFPASEQALFIAALSLLLLFPLLSHSTSASIDYCFRDLMMIYLTLSLSLMVPRGVQLPPVFMGEAERFPLAFSVSLRVGKTGVF